MIFLNIVFNLSYLNFDFNDLVLNLFIGIRDINITFPQVLNHYFY